MFHIIHTLVLLIKSLALSTNVIDIFVTDSFSNGTLLTMKNIEPLLLSSGAEESGLLLYWCCPRLVHWMLNPLHLTRSRSSCPVKCSDYSRHSYLSREMGSFAQSGFCLQPEGSAPRRVPTQSPLSSAWTVCTHYANVTLNWAPSTLLLLQRRCKI